MDNSKGQSNLTTGGIAAYRGSDPQNISFLWEKWGPCLIHETTRVSLPNGISFRLTALAGCTMTEDTQVGKRGDRLVQEHERRPVKHIPQTEQLFENY